MQQKQQVLMQIFRSLEMGSRTLIFTSTKRMCDQIGRSMGGMGVVIHGDKEQRERDRILSDFKSGRASIMIATDVRLSYVWQLFL